MQKLLISTVSLLGMVYSTSVNSSEVIKIGLLATLEGSHTVLGEDTVRGAQAALNKHNNKVDAKSVELVVKKINTTPKSALKAAQQLLDENISIIIGPLSSGQGIALKEFSKTKLQATFINGISGAVEATLVKPSENFFRFNTDNAQWSTGLGDYVFNEKSYKKVAIVAEDYLFNHAQVFGFATEYCASGGKISQKHWLPLGETDYSKIIANIKSDVDAVYLGLSGSSAIRFSRAYKQAGGKAQFIGSSITADDALLNSSDEIKTSFVGMPTAGPQADTWGDENWQSYVKAYKDAFPPEQRFVAPSILATGYYNATSAALLCLSKIGDNASRSMDKFRQCLGSLALNAPNGPIRLDENRQAIANNYVSEVVQQNNGTLVKKLVRIRQNVNQTLGFDKKEFAAIGLPSRDNHGCQNRD